MKNLFSKSILPLLPICFFAFLFSCDLQLQESFEFEPELGELETFEDMTAWEWVQTRTTPEDAEELDGEEFDYMIEAIQVAGLVEEYNGPTEDRTFLMLDNFAFTGARDIIDVITPDSVSDNTGTDNPSEDFENADVERLRELLRYHIVDAYVEQVPTLFEHGVNYQFQTLVADSATGAIFFQRDEQYRITINDAIQLPTAAISTRVRAHNYVYGNGIGHVLNNYVRNVPF